MRLCIIVKLNHVSSFQRHGLKQIPSTVSTLIAEQERKEEEKKKIKSENFSVGCFMDFVCLVCGFCLFGFCGLFVGAFFPVFLLLQS